jgi:hypothetical protein
MYNSGLKGYEASSSVSWVSPLRRGGRTTQLPVFLAENDSNFHAVSIRNSPLKCKRNRRPVCVRLVVALVDVGCDTEPTNMLPPVFVRNVAQSVHC